MARKARSSSRSRRSRSTSRSRRSRSRSRSHSGQYLSKASARRAFNRAYKGRPAAAKKDKSRTRSVTRRRKYLKDPKKYDYPGVDTRARKSKSRSRSLSKKRRSLSKKRRSASKKRHSLSKRNCWSDFTLKELQLITEDIGGRQFKDRTKLIKQLNKHFKIEESLNESLSRSLTKEKARLAIEKQMIAAKAAQKAQEAAEKVAQRAARKVAKAAARTASISASLSTPGSGSFSGNRQAIEDFIKGYAAKSYKTRGARLGAMRKDLGQTKNRTTDYAKWKAAPWEYDLEGVDTTRGSAENFLDSLTKAYRTENAGKLTDDDNTMWGWFTGGTSAAAPATPVFGGASPSVFAANRALADRAERERLAADESQDVSGEDFATLFGSSVQRRRSRRASRQGRRHSRRASRHRK